MGKPPEIADISHAQASFDATTYRHAGHTRIRLKATQGTTFVDPTYADRVVAAHTSGLTVDHYAFLTSENGSAQAAFFLNKVSVKQGDRFMADCEIPGVTAPITKEFIDSCHQDRPDIDGLIYGGPYFLRDNHIVSTHGWGLVLADYTTASKPVFWPPGFQNVPLEWQHTSSATVAGIPGPCDLSRVVRGTATPRDLTIWQHRRTVKFEAAMNNRRHPMTGKAKAQVDSAVQAAHRAEGIR